MATIEEIPDDVQNSDVDVSENGDVNEVSVPDKVQSRAERKSRKSMQGIGLKKVQGINRVVLKKARGQLLVISDPEVYKSSISDCYIVFGEAKPEDASAQMAAQQQQAQQMAASAGGAGGGVNDAQMQAQLQQLGLGGDSVPGAKKIQEEEEDDGEEVDETGVDAKDIELVMNQVSCSRKKAVKALKASDGDLINAIMNAQ